MKKNTKIANVYIVLVLATMYIPILMVIIYSFNAGRNSSVWEGFSLTWYEELFKDPLYPQAIVNSLVLALLSSVSAGIIGTLGAFGMAKVRLKSKGFIEYISTIPIMIPEIILGMVFLSFFALLGLPFGMTTLVIGHTAFCIPYVFLQVKARLSGMDKSLEEAALDLGANKVRAFIDVILPNILPAIASGMLLSFAMSFDDVIISVFVTGVNVNTLPLLIYTQLRTGVTPEVNALSTLMFLATIILCLLAYFIGRTPKSNLSEKRGKKNEKNT